MGQQEQTRTIMSQDYLLNIKVFSNLISHACSLLRLSDTQIREKYSGFPLCIMDLFEKKEWQRSIEIRFDDEQTSITCLFDASNRCDFTFIYPDHLNGLTEYVNFFNAIYDYDHTRRKWILANGYLSQKKSKDGIFFMINC